MLAAIIDLITKARQTFIKDVLNCIYKVIHKYKYYHWTLLQRPLHM